MEVRFIVLLALKDVIPIAKLTNRGITEIASKILSLFFPFIEKISDTAINSPYIKLRIRLDESKYLKSDNLVTVSISSTI